MKVNALKIRQSFGAVLRLLEKSREPVIIEKNRVPVAVLISIEDFEQRFLDRQDELKRQELIKLSSQAAEETDVDSLNLLRKLRYGGSR